MAERPRLDRPQQILVGTVAGGAVAIASIGFAGSYTAVQHLAAAKGFGAFAHVFPIGVDAGIVVLLALDLLLTWFRMPYPLLRPAAWLLTAATIAFNAAAAWPDPIGVGMHAVIPVLFVIAVEAARHAIGRSADITADRHVEPVPLRRWLLAFPSTFRLWRRMHLWQIRTLDEALRLEQSRLVYRARLRAQHGRGWRRSAPVDALLPLRLARHGVPLGAPLPEVAPVEQGEAPAAVAPAAPVRETPRAVEAPRPEPAPIVEAPRREALPIEAPRPAADTEAPRLDDAPVEAPRPAPAAPRTEAPRPDAAPAAPQRPAPAASRARQQRSTYENRAPARRIIRDLYTELGRRPREGEIVAALKEANYPFTSRQHAQKCRDELEHDEPRLVEIGADNVRAMTGT